MINQGNNVPDKTIVVFRDTVEHEKYVVGPHVVSQILKNQKESVNGLRHICINVFHYRLEINMVLL